MVHLQNLVSKNLGEYSYLVADVNEIINFYALGSKYECVYEQEQCDSNKETV